MRTDVDKRGTAAAGAWARIRRPDFFLVGAPKCGTTAMHQYLRRHPGIFLPSVKEINYFGADLTYNAPWEVSDEQYAGHFSAAGNAVRVGETSVMYLYSKSAPREIHRFNPDARILVMLRDPVETMYSHHNQLLSTADEDIEDFEEALAAEERRRQGLDIPELNFIADYLYYRDIVRFATQVSRYLEVFGRERVHVILFDDFIADTAACYRGTLEFLGVDPDFITPLERINASKIVRSAALRDFVKRPPAPVRRAVRLLTPLSLRHRMRQWLRNWNARETPRESMDAGLRRRLVREFEEEIRALEQLIGRDLAPWLEC